MVTNRNKKRKDRGKDRDRRFLNLRLNKRMVSIIQKLSIGVVASIAVIVIAFLYKYKIESNYQKLEDTLSALIREENSVAIDRSIRVAVGFGSCQDIIVQSNEVVLDRAPEIPQHFYSISTKEQFLKVFAYFYRHGAAAERFITNATLFDELVQLSKDAPSARYFIGGNAPVMAKRFVKEGWNKILLGAQVSQSLQKQFPAGIQISGPIVEEDDVHLLLEYPSGQKWGTFIPPRANRFIIHNDHQNPQLSSLSTFLEQLKNFNPNLLVIGGLQMMDNFPMPEIKQLEHFQKVQNLMKSQPDNVRIHFEMASFSDENLLKNLVETVIPYADSLGMNEQELPNLYQMIKYGNISLLADSRPRIAVILDQMRKVVRLLQERASTNGHRKLTRLHVHTLAFQAMMVDRNSAWKNTKAAAAKSALTANRHTCGSDTIDIQNAKLIMDDAFTTSMKQDPRRIPFNPKDPVSCWDEHSYTVCIAPVLVCTEVLQTGGGGDNISSAGLVLQI